ncbi:hypothetical protein BJ508DRAFT_2947 [Ascobolus immersus RN42]|uniref:Uncharacterized protein n=1 Tax=Ascobolus immersus RN42 TaxID=1160509 RepID=A0A3N4IV88_ASCIM|nr:hypothetical protein BJ508DRAFT_2947 [Ascobolus immersus RN42]
MCTSLPYEYYAQDSQYIPTTLSSYYSPTVSLGGGTDLVFPGNRLGQRSAYATYANYTGGIPVYGYPETSLPAEAVAPHSTAAYTPQQATSFPAITYSSSSSLDALSYVPIDTAQSPHSGNDAYNTSESRHTTPPEWLWETATDTASATDSSVGFDHVPFPGMPASAEWNSMLASAFVLSDSPHPHSLDTGIPTTDQPYQMTTATSSLPADVRQHQPMAYPSSPHNLIDGQIQGCKTKEYSTSPGPDTPLLISSHTGTQPEAPRKSTIPLELRSKPQPYDQGTLVRFEQVVDGKSQKKNKRKAFDPESREKVKLVRQKKACIRCRMNKRSCSTDDYCKGCVSLVKRIGADAAILKHICFRHSLFDLRFNQVESGAFFMSYGLFELTCVLTYGAVLPTWDEYMIVGKHVEEASQNVQPLVLRMGRFFRESFKRGEMTEEGVDMCNELVPKAITGQLKKGEKLPQYLEYWQQVCLKVWQRKRRTLSATFTVTDFFTLIQKLQYSQSPDEIDKHESLLLEALITFVSIFFCIKYSAADPTRELPPGHSRASYIAAIDFMEGILIKETDKMLNRIGQYPKRKIDGLMALLEVWEVRYAFGAVWRAAVSKQNLDGFGSKDIPAFKGLEGTISGLRTALLGRI